ncbi:MAG: MMPL family transporter [Pseudomonadota bacterium]
MADAPQQAARTAVDRFALRFTESVIRYRWLVILAAILAAVGIASQAQHLSFGTNYRVFFSTSNPELAAFEEFQATYTKNDNIFFFIDPQNEDGVFNERVMSAVAALTEGGWQLPHSIRVDSVTNFQYTRAEEDDLIVEDLIADPSALSPEQWASKRAIALAEPLLAGQVVSRDGRRTAVNVVIQYPGKSNAETPAVAEAARNLRDTVAADFPGLDIRLTGVGMLNVSFSESGQRDYSTLVPGMFGLVLLLTLITVRSLSVTLAVFGVIVLSLMVTLGTGGMMRVALTPISLSSAIVVLTLAVADSIHILLTMRGNMRRGMVKRDALVDALRVNFLAVGITSLTTMVGFLALNSSDAPPFWHLGNMSAAGIGAAWLLSITLLPALVSLLPFSAPTRGAEKDGADGAMGKLADTILAHRNVLAGLSLAGAIGLVAMLPRMEFNDQWTQYFDERIPFRPASDLATEHFGLYPVEFSVESGAPGGVSDPAYLQRLDAFAEWLKTRDEVAHTYSISDIMKRLNKNLHGDDESWYRLPDDRELSAQYLLLYELSLPYGLDLNDRINIDKSATRVTATLGNVSTADTKAFLRDANEWLDANFPTDLKPLPTSANVMFTYITDRNVNQMIRGTILAIAAISLIMMVTFRHVRLGLLALVPNTLPILTAFGAWAALVGEVGFSIAVVAAISLGIVVDDTVHIMTKYLRARREKALPPPAAVRYAFITVGPAIIVNTIILALGFALLMFSTFKVTVDMGLLTMLSILFALVLDLLFLPALLIWTDRTPKPVNEGDSHAAHDPALA